MRPERRYADWRPVAARRWATAWVGTAVGTVAGLSSFAFLARTPFPFFVFGLGGLVAQATTHFLVERQMRELRDGADLGQHPVALSLRREAAYGHDEGLVSFVDGWLVYSGRRCAFSVRAADVESQPQRGRNGEIVFAFGGPGGEYEARLAVRRDHALHSAILDWIGSRGVPGDSVFPPVVPHETGSVGFVLVMLVALVVLNVAAFLLPRGSWLGIPACVSGLGALVLYVSQVKTAMGRLERGEPARPLFWNRRQPFRRRVLP